MQLRYVVLHGPAKLIVRGNGGVNVGMVDDGVSINQAATLGPSSFRVELDLKNTM
jgi:hypothetical protein